MSEYLPYVVSVLCAVVSGFVSVAIAKKQAKTEIQKVEKQYELDLEKRRLALAEEKDQALFETINSVFSDDIQLYLRDFDFKDIHPTTVFSSLHKLCHDSKNPLFCFINTELEAERVKMFDDIQELVSFHAAHTFPVGSFNPDYSATSFWFLDNGDSFRNFNNENETEQQRYERLKLEAEKLNGLASTAWKSYSDFVAHGNAILFGSRSHLN